MGYLVLLWEKIIVLGVYVIILYILNICSYCVCFSGIGRRVIFEKLILKSVVNIYKF